MSSCEFFGWLICTVGQLHRRIVGEGSKTLCINKVMSSVQLMSHFSSRPHPAGFCRTILLMFSIAASAPGFVNPECFFSLKQNYRKFQNKRIFCKGGGEGEEEEENGSFKHCLCTEFEAINFIYRSLFLVPFLLTISAPQACSEPVSHISCNRLWWIMLMACTTTDSLFAGFFWIACEILLINMTSQTI